MPLKIEHPRMYDDIRRAFSRSIEDPIPVKLGTLDETTGAKLLKVPSTETDTPNAYYFSELPNMQEFRGWAQNAGPAALQPQYLRYGMPIYIKRDVLNGVWLIHGLASDFASEYVEGVDLVGQEPVHVSQITVGLLDETDPPSMTGRVMGAWYNDNYWETQITTSVTSHVPATNGRARFRLVEIDPATGTLTYTNGGEFDALLTNAQAYAIDVAGSIVPRPAATRFRVGYFKLVAGMTAVKRSANVWAGQELLTKGGAGTFSGARATRITTDFSVTTNTDTIVDFNGEDYDTATIHDNATNPSRLTVPTTGYWRIGWKLNLSSTTQWSNDFLINGTLDETIVPVTTAGGQGIYWITKSLTSGQYVQLQVWQNSGVTQQVQIGSWFACEFIGT